MDMYLMYSVIYRVYDGHFHFLCCLPMHVNAAKEKWHLQRFTTPSLSVRCDWLYI